MKINDRAKNVLCAFFMGCNRFCALSNKIWDKIYKNQNILSNDAIYNVKGVSYNEKTFLGPFLLK